MSEHALTVVITGTDTGVGKSVLAAGLGRGLARRGVRVVAIKPIESGCAEAGAAEEDGQRLARATGQAAPLRALCRLRAVLAPPVAADAEGASIPFAGLVRQIRELGRCGQVVLVEGAGGLLSPLTWSHTTLDLALQLEAPAVVVARDTLGVINHTGLTLEALSHAGVRVLGVVLSAPLAADLSVATNLASLRRLHTATRFAALARVRTDDQAADALEPVAQWILAEARL